MSETLTRRIVLGIGNPDRGDDGAGRAAIELLRGTLPADVQTLGHSGEATALIGRLSGMSAAYFIDACVSGAPAGSVRRFDVGAAPLPQTMFRMSTHGFGLGEAVELVRALGQMPPRCIVYAIEGASFDAGAALSPRVAAAVVEVAHRLRAEIVDGSEGGGHA